MIRTEREKNHATRQEAHNVHPGLIIILFHFFLLLLLLLYTAAATVLTVAAAAVAPAPASAPAPAPASTRSARDECQFVITLFIASDTVYDT